MSDSSATAWAIACQAPPSMGISKQEYWSGLPFPSPQKHYTVIKGSAHQGYIILSKSTPAIRASKYMKQNLVELKGEIDKATVKLITSPSHSQQLRDCATESKAVESLKQAHAYDRGFHIHKHTQQTRAPLQQFWLVYLRTLCSPKNQWVPQTAFAYFYYIILIDFYICII